MLGGTKSCYSKFCAHWNPLPKISQSRLPLVTPPRTLSFGRRATEGTGSSPLPFWDDDNEIMKEIG